MAAAEAEADDSSGPLYLAVVSEPYDLTFIDICINSKKGGGGGGRKPPSPGD
jgi:hypothetical protein